MIFNYLRVSTILQNSDRQLHNVPCDRDYIDKISGKDLNRHQFKLMMDNLREGDIVNVHSLDRVGRNTADILDLVKQIKEKGCSIKFHKENLTFDGTKSDLYSELLLTVLAAFSQFERSIILERQREGIAIAKAKGVYKGRKAKLSSEQIKLMKADFHAGIAKTKIAEKYGVTRSYVYQLVKQETKDEIKKEDVSLDVIGKHYKKAK
ncbi:MAG: recombinase family protein [Bacteroidales bacterium]|jgi:DNA invertase Pin-like site-specific DNA recombinase